MNTLIWKERKYKAYRCKNCTVAFFEPVPEGVENIYNEEYFQKWYIRYYKERKEYTENLFSFIDKHIKETGKLLDVGCGTGILLEVARKKGWEVYGQDVASFAVEYCKNKGLNIFNGPLQELDLAENFFDVITIFDVLAHLKSPLSYINKCIKLLKPGGYLIIKTPYHSSLLFFLANLLSFTGKSRSLLHIPAQIFHFNENSLKAICTAGCFKLLKTHSMKDFSSLRGRGFIHIMLRCVGADKSLAAFWRKE